ncbi:hypothetical protein [Streptomyces sp. NPDC006012]|uniref:hypothetical protein n=1 Tax=Streptomyces sp. NPDC006012 TaxID=3364739 RepID=UPI0036C0661A
MRTPHPVRPLSVLLGVLLPAALALTGCGASDTASSSADSAGSPWPWARRCRSRPLRRCSSSGGCGRSARGCRAAQAPVTTALAPLPTAPPVSGDTAGRTPGDEGRADDKD